MMRLFFRSNDCILYFQPLELINDPNSDKLSSNEVAQAPGSKMTSLDHSPSPKSIGYILITSKLNS